MAISKVVPVTAGGGGGVAPQQSVMSSAYRVPRFHPGSNPWGEASKTIDKFLPALTKTFKNKRTIEALKRAMGPKPEGASKLTNMAYKIMEAGASTNDPQLYSQGISMLGKQEGRQYQEGRDEFRYGRGRGHKLEDLFEGRDYREGLYGTRRDESRGYREDRIEEGRQYQEGQYEKRRDETRLYSKEQYESRRDESRSYTKEQYEERRGETRKYNDELYWKKTEDRRGYGDRQYKERKRETRGYNEDLYEKRLEARTTANSKILKEKREYAWKVYEEKRGYKIPDALKLQKAKRDDKKAYDDAKLAEKRSYTERQSVIKYERSHPHDFGGSIGRVTTSQAYSMWKEANDLESEMGLQILKAMDPIGYEREKAKIADSEGQFNKWISDKVELGKFNAETGSRLGGTIPDSGSGFSMEGITPPTDTSKYRDMSPKEFNATY
jgi:hypothetical protein